MKLNMRRFPANIGRNVHTATTSGATANIREKGVSMDTSSIKKMTWGEPTWLLFHTISVKIKETEFPNCRRELLPILYGICCNLPCPDCANHAKEYLNRIHFNEIQTKHQLKTVFFQFHNMVNKKKEYPIFEWNDIDAKYSKANLIPIVNNFIRFYTNNTGTVRMISDDFHRKQIVENLKQWLSKNIDAFVG
jgi:hypothetical protein